VELAKAPGLSTLQAAMVAMSLTNIFGDEKIHEFMFVLPRNEVCKSRI
jgi:hypothetical protein